MEEEKVQKLTYINENIIEKGYNPEELSNFIIKKIGIPMENLNFQQLKDMIEKFKDQSLQDTYQTVKIKEVSQKEESPFDILYSSQVYDIKTQAPQETKLLELEKNKEKLVINISEPKKEKSAGFFSKSIYSYRVVTPLLEKDVRRTYNDFEWLREQFVIRYPLRLVPPIITEKYLAYEEIVEKNDSEEVMEEKKIKYLNNYMRKLIQKKIFRTSPILYEFLELEDSKFKKYREILNKQRYELNITLDNFRTYKDTIHCEMKKEDIKKADVFNKKYTNICEIYQKLDISLANVVNDFLLLYNHMKEIADSFNQLSLEFSDNDNKDNKNKLNIIYSELNKIFNQWSTSYGNQYIFFKNDFKSIFKYLNSETQELSQIYKSYISFKNEYEDFTNRINKKKEDLFLKKDYKNWSLAPGTENQLPMFQNNKKIAFEKMLYKETFLLAEEKKRLAAAVYYLFKGYNKMIKYQGMDLEYYLKYLKENQKLIIGDAYTLIGLFSIIKEEQKEEKKEEKKKDEKKEEKKEEIKEEKKEEKKEEIKEEKKEIKEEEKKNEIKQ